MSGIAIIRYPGHLEERPPSKMGGRRVRPATCPKAQHPSKFDPHHWHQRSEELQTEERRSMALHPNFPRSPYAILPPDLRWFPAAEELRSTAYEKLLPPLVAKVREEVEAWRAGGYEGASGTSRALVAWWVETDPMSEEGEGMRSKFRYYFAQREAVESVIWLYDVRGARDKFDLLRFDASGAVSTNMFDEDWPRFVVKMATGAGKTKVLSLLMARSEEHTSELQSLRHLVCRLLLE